jgi:hypothetical protein
MQFTSCRQNTRRVKNLISLRPLETFDFHNSTLSSNNQAPTRTWPSHIHPQRWGWARWRRGRARAGKQATLDYDLAHHGPTCKGGLAGDVTGERRRRGRAGSKSGEDRGGADQQAAVWASGWPRARARGVHGLGKQVEGEARRRAFNGVQRQSWALARGRAASLNRRVCLGGGVRRVVAQWVTVWAPRGGGDVRHRQPMAQGGVPSGVCEQGAWHQPRAGACHPYPANSACGAGLDRRSLSCLSVRAYSRVRRRADVAGHDTARATSHARHRLPQFDFDLACLTGSNSQFCYSSEPKCL